MNERRSAQLRHPPAQASIVAGSLYFAMAADTRLQLVAGDDVSALAASAGQLVLKG
jgi:hypothetical protein